MTQPDLPPTQRPTPSHLRVSDLPEPRAHHDIGGIPRFLCDPIDPEPHALNDFDREVDAIRGILGAKGVMSVDELRRGIEAIPEQEYFQLAYYERWIRSIAANLIARGVITEAELQAAIASDAQPFRDPSRPSA